MGTSSKKKSNKKTLDLNCTLDQTDLRDIYKTLYPTAVRSSQGGGWATLLVVWPSSSCSFPRSPTRKESGFPDRQWPLQRTGLSIGFCVLCRQVHKHSWSISTAHSPTRGCLSFNSFRVRVQLTEQGDHTSFQLSRAWNHNRLHSVSLAQAIEGNLVNPWFPLTPPQTSSFSLLGAAEGIAAPFLCTAKTLLG